MTRQTERSELERYNAFVLDAAVAAMETGACSLRAVVEHCHGADPLTVRDSLRTTQFGHKAVFQNLDDANAIDDAVERTLPPPHPLDFEWRFSKNGASAILEHVDRLGCERLLVIGATTVAIAAARRGWNGSLIALDQSVPVIAAAQALQLPIEFITADVKHFPARHLNADVVVIDPPWYLDFAQAFFAVAAIECQLGGYVLASLPGEGTRPGIHHEREQVMAWCSRIGLERLALHSQSVAYETPQFERNAFRAAGLTGSASSWRRGDLCVLRKTHEQSFDYQHIEVVAQSWDELHFGGTRVRFSRNPHRSGDTRLTTIVDGDVLPSVSRRDSRRDRVRVWTSGNRVFGCEDTGTLFAAAQARMHGKDEIEAATRALERHPSNSEEQVLRQSCDRLTELGLREMDE